MFTRCQFWFKTGSWLLVVTGLIHELSLFSSPEPANEHERQLLDLMSNYCFTLPGAVRSMGELMRFFFQLTSWISTQHLLAKSQ